ncbi:MAG TPA: Trp biosynthesis-associated membrane protein [Actinomycetota bacterium]
MDDLPTADRRRAAGFVVAVVGALTLGVGSLLDWISVGIAGVEVQAITPTERGVDRPDGIAALVLAVVALVAAVASRGRSGRARPWAAAVVLAAGLAAVVVVGLAVATGPQRAEDRELDAFAETAGLDPDEVAGELGGILEGRAEPGLAVALAGAAITVAGGALLVAWAGRATRGRRPEPGPSPSASPDVAASPGMPPPP